MEQRYRVKLQEGHSAKKSDIVNGYLGNVFGTGRIELYTRGEAITKATMFGGKAEIYRPKFHIEPIRVAQIDRKTISKGLEDILNEYNSGKVYGRESDEDGFYYASTIDDVLASEHIVISDEAVLREMQDLSQYLTNYDYIMLIS